MTITKSKIQKLQNKKLIPLMFLSEEWTNLYFRFPQSLNHESIILGQEKNTPTFPRRRKFPQSIIPTNGHHVISSINLEQFP